MDGWLSCNRVGCLGARLGWLRIMLAAAWCEAWLAVDVVELSGSAWCPVAVPDEMIPSTAQGKGKIHTNVLRGLEMLREGGALATRLIKEKQTIRLNFGVSAG